MLVYCTPIVKEPPFAPCVLHDDRSDDAEVNGRLDRCELGLLLLLLLRLTFAVKESPRGPFWRQGVQYITRSVLLEKVFC